ncbi:hypothetical protein HispidOSU_010165, partial [Sigmodon hispidus]
PRCKALSGIFRVGESGKAEYHFPRNDLAQFQGWAASGCTSHRQSSLVAGLVGARTRHNWTPDVVRKWC